MSGPALPLPFLLAAALVAQDPQGPPGGGFPGGGFPGGPGGGFPGGPGGGPGGMMGQSTKVKEQFDADKNGVLDAAERTAARAWLKENRPQRGRRGPGGGMGGPGGGFPGGPGGEGGQRDTTPKVGGKVTPGDVPNHQGRPLFDAGIVRTFFLTIPGDDWHAELTDFYRTDVEVPATVEVDGVTYQDVGVQFRGNTSFMSPGKKKSLDLSFDLVHDKQNLLGARNLDLLNCNTDATSLREMAHGWLANQFFPAPRVALARVVVNGEDYGVYAAVQQFDKEYLQDHYGTKQGDRWKVPPNFSGSSGLRYLGDDPAVYKRNYEIKSADKPEAWQALVDVCGAINEAPEDRLEAIVPQHLDVDATLWFLAMDMAVGDDDGYFSRASDYLLYRDPRGRFHPIPRDNNEILLGERTGRGPGGGGPGGGPGGERRPDAPADGGNRPGQGPGGGFPGGAGPGGPGGPGGMRGGPGGGTANTPLQGASRQDRPLLHRLLAVPAWKERYLANLRELAMAMGDDGLGRQLGAWRTLLDPLVQVDAHSLYGHDAFRQAFATDDAGKPAARSMLATIAKRRKAILDDPALQGAWPELGTPQTAVQGGDGAFVLHVTCKASGAAIRTVRLHHDKGAFGGFTATEMHDDGQHGDGAAGDGVYGLALPPVAAGETWRYWLEAVAAESGHVDCQPAGNGARPFTWSAPDDGKKDKGKDAAKDKKKK